MAGYNGTDETTEWLNYLQPEGLVLGANVLRQHSLTPIRQTPLDTEDAIAALGLDVDAPRSADRSFVLADPWSFFERVLEWPTRLVAGAPGGPPMPDDLTRTLPEHTTLLSSDLALMWNGPAETGVTAQALVLLHPTLDPDSRGQFGEDEWEASPHQRLERLLRETGVGAGILVARNTLRLVYAPPRETAGWISWPLAPLGRVDGRPMLAGLKLALGKYAFFVGPENQRLRRLLKESRDAQNEVSEKLSSQVLEALHELLRGLHRAAPDRIESLAEQDAHHLYEGLLTCLMRLVFLLYAEDRDLLPTRKEGGLKALWDSGYSIKTLYSRLLADEAINPDTMDERRGAWGQLLAVFRIIHAGATDWVAARGGKLFDPAAFPFLEGRDKGSECADAKVLPVSDGTILRILYGLMTVEGKSLSGAKIRERLSYRSLDVESIGSVYETVMGFTAKRAREPMIALRDEKKLPAFVGLGSLLAQKPADRQKWLKEQSISPTPKVLKAVKEANDVPELLAALGSAIDLRASPGGIPVAAGVPYLQPTEERRRSGSHYTPRSLTEPIVRHALEPSFERIGENASPEEVLSLKVLDPACGSGAFLVEACRQLGRRLEQAWDMHNAEKPAIPPDEDDAIHARRLVAQRCLYGVDRNPMAVDLARLSLWLVTLASEHEFTFLDHAIKAGDSLVGLTPEQIAAVNWDESKGIRLLGQLIKEELDRAFIGREAIRSAPDDVMRAVQESKHRRVESDVEPARQVGDAVIAAFFSADKPKVRSEALAEVENWISGHLPPLWEKIAAASKRFQTEQGWRPFHWQVEFPEVFMRDNPGFDAIVGNPPFAGKNTIIAASAPNYLPWLQQLHKGAHGNADLVAHFFRRAFGLLRRDGTFGLIATNTIGQGDTRKSGLSAITADGGGIARAIRRLRWPGQAAVVVSVVHVRKGPIRSPVLGLHRVSRISAYLVEGDLDWAPHRLAASSGIAFKGGVIMGKGFIFSDDDDSEYAGTTDFARELIQRNASNRQIIWPYVAGGELNAMAAPAAQRFIVNFADMELEEAKRWPDLLQIVEAKVMPERLKLKGNRDAETRKRLWWRWGRYTAALYDRASKLERVFVCAHTGPHKCFAHLPSRTAFDQSLIAFCSDHWSLFSIIQGRVHEIWNVAQSSSMKDDLRYTPSDCFETFPFPIGYETDVALEAIGKTYYDLRAKLMVEANEGMTKIYNRFHEYEETGEAIRHLRELHDDMDRAVLRAYGWDDLVDTLKPEFLTEETEDEHTYQGRYFWPAAERDLVLSRLLALNAERYEEEVRQGLHEKGRKRTKEEDDELELEAEGE